MEDLNDILRAIKTQFRLSMNGAAAASMREKGLNYRVNFGIELPRLKQIATMFPKNCQLAQTLWNEEVRESKILAALLMPVEEFLQEVADIWVDEIRTQEIAELTTMNLFQYLPYAPSMALRWISSAKEFRQICGFQLIARLLAKRGDMPERVESEFHDQAIASFLSGSYALQMAVTAALRRYMQHSKEHAFRVCRLVEAYHEATDGPSAMLYQAVADEASAYNE